MAFFVKEPKTTELEVSDKHVLLRTICFFLALAVAVSAIAYGVSRIIHKGDGLYSRNVMADQEVPLYQNGVHANFYFRGSSNQIRIAVGSAEKLYSQALKEAYMLLDATREYPGCVNLASLNAHLNEDLQVSPELFAVLTDAYAKTLEQKGYSLFAGPVYAEWESILVLSEPEDFDPLANEEEQARLERLRQLTGDLSQFRLTVVNEEEHILRLEAPESYPAALEDLELEYGATADLNILREAYLLELVAARLEAQGLQEGYLCTDSGLILALSGLSEGECYLYGQREGKLFLAAAAPVEPGSAFSRFTAFPLVSGEGEFYVFEDEEGSHLRNPYLPADGVDAELLLSSCVLRKDGKLAEACYENLCLHAVKSADEAERLAGESDSAVAWMLQGDERAQVFTNPAARDLIVPR